MSLLYVMTRTIARLIPVSMEFANSLCFAILMMVIYALLIFVLLEFATMNRLVAMTMIYVRLIPATMAYA